MDGLLIIAMVELMLIMDDLLIMILYETSNISAQKLLLNNKFLSCCFQLISTKDIINFNERYY